VIGLAAASNGELGPGACCSIVEEACAYHAVLIGPGMIDGVAGAELAAACLQRAQGPTLVLDAAPLAEFEALCATPSPSPPREPRLVLTPHPGEMSRLCGIARERIMERPLEIAREVAARTGAVIALKAATTYVVAPDGTAFKNTAGNIGLGTSGSGDVLAGIIAGLCARGAPALQAAVWGVHLHASAGDVLARKVGVGFLAREIADEIPALLAALTPRRRLSAQHSAEAGASLPRRMLGRSPTPTG
jgi:ADP-dependent NAD(P)H-hydrate dehydratase